MGGTLIMRAVDRAQLKGSALSIYCWKPVIWSQIQYVLALWALSYRRLLSFQDPVNVRCWHWNPHLRLCFSCIIFMSAQATGHELDLQCSKLSSSCFAQITGSDRPLI